MLTGVVTDPTFFAYIRRADTEEDWRDERVWKDANPALGKFRSIEEITVYARVSAAHKLRELFYNLFMFEDHTLHFYFLGGPDFIVGPDAPPAERNIVGVIGKVGIEAGKKVISTRRRLRELIAYFGGKVVHPVLGLPGGVSKALAPADLPKFKELAKDGVEFAEWTLAVLKQIVLGNPDYVKMITSDAFTHKTCYMGMVDEDNKVNFYDGKLRVVDCTGLEIYKFAPQQYREFVAEHRWRHDHPGVVAALEHLEVRAAGQRRLDLEHDLARPGRRTRHGLDDHVHPAAQHGRAHVQHVGGAEPFHLFHQ